jgi:hypothetical protein
MVASLFLGNVEDSSRSELARRSGLPESWPVAVARYLSELHLHSDFLVGPLLRYFSVRGNRINASRTHECDARRLHRACVGQPSTVWASEQLDSTFAISARRSAFELTSLSRVARH